MKCPTPFDDRQRAFPMRPTAQAALLLSLCAPLFAIGQDAVGVQTEPGTGNQPSVIQRVEIVARQGSTELRRAASVAKQIYGREELDRYGDTNTLDVLRRLPGVNVDSGGPRMRGLGAGYTQILINGDPAPQGFNLDQLSPSQIERIEVIKAATADQSTQAIAGTINVILKETSRRALSSLRVGVSNGRDRPTGNLNYSISESRGPFNLSLPVSVFEWNRQVRNLVDRKMAGTDGQPALSEQLGTNTSWGWGYNVAPRFNYKISDEQTLSLATFFQKGYWNYSTDYVNRAVSGNPVFDDNAIQGGFWENRRGNLTWIHRFSEDQRIEIKAGVQQFRGGFDLNNLRSNVTQLKTNGNNRDDAITQAGKYSQLLGDQHTLTAGWDLETRERQERRTTTDGAGLALLAAFEGQAFEAKMNRQAFYIQDEWEISPVATLFGLAQRTHRV